MNIDIRAQNLTLTDIETGVIRDRVRFALGRFEGKITRVSVVFSDINGPRGGVDTKAVVKITGPRKLEIVASSTADGPIPASSFCLDKAARTIAREVKKRRLRSGTIRTSLRSEAT